MLDEKGLMNAHVSELIQPARRYPQRSPSNSLLLHTFEFLAIELNRLYWWDFVPGAEMHPSELMPKSVPSMLTVVIKSYQGEKSLDPSLIYWFLMPKRTT
jgi:hypothetical protein